MWRRESIWDTLTGSWTLLLGIEYKGYGDDSESELEFEEEEGKAGLEGVDAVLEDDR